MSLSLGYIYYEATTLLQPVFGYLFNRATRRVLFTLTLLLLPPTFVRIDDRVRGNDGSNLLIRFLMMGVFGFLRENATVRYFSALRKISKIA
jgi:hypothetical protein